MKRWLLGLVLVSPAALVGQSAVAAFEACVAESACAAREQSAFTSGYNTGLAEGSSQGGSSGYSDGYAAGLADGTAQGSTAGYDTGYAVGVSDGTTAGRAEAVAECQDDPPGCGITLDTLVPAAAYGETEYNDNMVSADPLIGDTSFWGQSSSASDQDWFYLITDRPNKILTVLFSVPERDPGTSDAGGWRISVRDAFGNLHAQFNTDYLTGNPNGDDQIAYPLTLGFAGTYYVVVEPVTLTGDWYQVTVTLRDSGLNTPNFLIGAYDAEREFNDRPQDANRITSGVTVYGLINLTFDGVGIIDGTYAWGQGEYDWYRYDSPGNEIVTLSFCEREVCPAGNWYLEVYDEVGAFALQSEIDAGTEQENIQTVPMLALNTDLPGSSDAEARSIRFGLSSPGRYYLRANHKRLVEAPCARWGMDVNKDGAIEIAGLDSGGNLVATRACGCTDGRYKCSLSIINPADNPLSGYCPDGTQLQEGVIQCSVDCLCLSFGLLVEVPEGLVTSQYNFTLVGTRVSSDTSGTDGYDDYLDRPAYALVDDAQKAYIAYYSRPGDPSGVDYWAGRLAGDPGGLGALVSAFWASAEAAQRYGGMSDTQILEALYSELFGRAMDPGGRDYWTGRLTSGTSTVDRVMLEVLQGASGTDAATIANKLAVAKYVTDGVKAAGGAWNNDHGRTVLRNVTANAATIEPAKALARQLFGF